MEMWQAADAHIRGVRSGLPEFGLDIPFWPRRVPFDGSLPVIGDPWLYLPLSCAIAHDTGATISQGGTSNYSGTLTFGTLTNGILLVGVNSDHTTPPTAISYDGVAMTEADHENFGSHLQYLYWVVGAVSGKTLSITGPAYTIVWETYQGASQSGQPDAHSNSYTGASSVITISGLTAVAASTWAVAVITDATGTAGTANTGCVLRRGATSNDWSGVFDSNGTVAAGSVTMKMNVNAALNNRVADMTISPATGAAFIASQPVTLLQAVKRASIH